MRDALRNLAIVASFLCGLSTSAFGQEQLRDPTRPYAVKQRLVVAAPNFKVNAIIVSADRRVAIVNGQRVIAGGSVDGATVITIEKDHLVLEKNGKRITSTLNDRASRQ
ncbi:MAG: hypothetical protein ACR2Q3_02960 [Woeseiaceae bacterium]